MPDKKIFATAYTTPKFSDNLPKNFQFTIFKDKEDPKWFLANCWVDGKKYMTQGRSEDEIFDMIADLYKCVLDIKCSWYRRLIFKIFRV